MQQKHSYRDFWILYSSSILVLFISAHYNLFEAVGNYVHVYEKWQLDEYIIVLTYLAFALGIVSYKKSKDLENEIQRRIQIEDDLLQAKINAEDANNAKSVFLATMSHELRTPLNSIIGFSDILLECKVGSLNEKQIRYVRNVSNSGNHLLNIINDILDISKIESGKMDFLPESISVQDTINEVLASCYSLATGKKIELKCNMDCNIATIKADRVKLKQILYNLVSNAIKFTPAGGKVSLDIKSGDKKIIFKVIDTGDGISKEDQKKLFKVFGQLDAANNRKYEGTGLGLAIVKKLVEMHKGLVWIESEIGKGATFAFEIPVEQ